ncbi:hypothetical protein [uncultured Aurantimicrobium sp.]|nr:hypothetical protein [uncultured Aurantimicrobium sp.]
MITVVRCVVAPGQQAEEVLHASGINVNRNSVPFDPRPPGAR